MHSGHLKVQTFPISLSTPKARSVGLSSSEAKPIRVLIIDDHAVIRAALRMFLDSQPGIAVVGESSGPQDALAAAACEQPDIILLDLDLGEANGLDLLPDLHATAPDAHVVVLTGVRDVRMHRQAVRLGAVGLVLKERAPEVLIEAIAKVAAGEVWLENLLVASVLSEMTRRPQPHPPGLQEPNECRPAGQQRIHGAPPPDIDLRQAGRGGSTGAGDLCLSPWLSLRRSRPTGQHSCRGASYLVLKQNPSPAQVHKA
jgi:DNA-binding NarL/FixJ family response regulator